MNKRQSIHWNKSKKVIEEWVWMEGLGFRFDRTEAEAETETEAESKTDARAFSVVTTVELRQ